MKKDIKQNIQNKITETEKKKLKLIMFTKLENPFSVNWKNQMAGNSFQYFVKKGI